MAEQPQTIMDAREELMVSPKGGKPIKKIAHFIKPTFKNSDLTPDLPSISLPFRPISIDCTFNGWKNPTKSWVSWVDRLHSSCQYIWKRAGIYDAILSSKYKIIRNDDLFFSLAERWCCETNTFVFSWGEATVSLEDVVVLGGYSVLGDSASGFDNNDEFVAIEKKLNEVYKEMSKGPLMKAKHGQWMKYFMDHGFGTGIEHEAFLSYWLSRFVLPTFPYDVVVKSYFKIAIVLAAGFQRSLAPVVLASIYRDLSLLKSAMINSVGTSTEGSGRGDGFDDLVKVTVWAPLQLVQVWAWERFPEFRPNPGLVRLGEPRLARWDGVKEREIGNVRPLLQSAGHSFEWRPYCKEVENIPLPMFYRESEKWFLMSDVIGDDVKSMVRFLRVCELVGLDNTIEQYNPNRVAMQFGFDQDVPDHAARGLLNSDIPRRELVQLAWFTYISPTQDAIMFVPSKSYEPQVSLRYLNWLRRGVLMKPASWSGIKRKKRSFKRRSRASDEVKKVNNAISMSIVAALDINVKPSFVTKVVGDDLDVPPGFTPQPNASSKKPCLLPGLTQNNNVGHNKSDAPLVLPRESVVAGNEADVPPGFTPKISNVGNTMDAPPGFTPNINGSNHSFPLGFPPKPNASSKKACLLPGLTQNNNIGHYKSDVPLVLPRESVVPGNEADVPPGFTPKISNVGNTMDAPPGFTPNSNGSNRSFPSGLPPKPNASSKKACLLPGMTQNYNVGHYKSDVPLVLPHESVFPGEEADVPPGFTPKSINGCSAVDAPPGFTPNINGSNHTFPSGFSQRSYEQCKMDVEKKDGYGMKSEVKVKEEYIESTGENRQQLLRCSYQTLYTSSLAEIRPTPGGDSGMSAEVARGVGHTALGLAARIQENDRMIAKLSKTRSDKVTPPV